MATDKKPFVYGEGKVPTMLHEMPSGRTIVEHAQSQVIEVEVKAKPSALLIQPNILTGAGVLPCTYKECTSVGFYLLREDGSKDWLTDINKSDNTSKDYSHIHSTAARFSMVYSTHILPFEMS